MDTSFFLDRPIAFQRPFVALGIGITGALMLSQAVYWSRRLSGSDGWFFKTQAEWEDETGLTRREQEGARNRLRQLGVFHEEARGIPAKLYYRVDFAVLDALMHETAKQGCAKRVKATKPPSSREQKRQPVQAKTAKQSRAKAPTSAGENRQPNTRKTTTETTTETTAETSAGGGALPPAREEIAMVLTAPSGRVYEVPASLRYPREESPTHKTWMSYAIAYLNRYQAWPVWNASVAGQVAQLIQRVGADAAPKVAAHYVMRVNEAFVLKKMHSFKLLLGDAEGYHAQMQSGRTVTAAGAARQDRTETNANAADEATAVALAILANRQQGGGHEQ